MLIKKVALISQLNNSLLVYLNNLKWGFISTLKTISLLILLICNFSYIAKTQEKIVGHGGPVKGLTVSNSGYLVSTSFDYSSIIWSINDMREVISLNDHLAAVNVAKFSPDEKKLVTAGDDTRVLVYDIQKPIKKSLPRELGKHLGKVSDITFSPNGN